MKGILSLIVFLLSVSYAFAAMDAQYDFEAGVPSFVKATGNGTLTSSSERFKDGKTSVRFDWEGEAGFEFINFSDIETSMKVGENGLMMWVYSPKVLDGPLRFTIWDWYGKEICHFDFNLFFKGWRALWIKYVDMHVPDGGYYGHIPQEQRNKAAARMTVSAPSSVPSGTIWFDRMTFTRTRINDRVTPDLQIPDNNATFGAEHWQWCRLWEWENYPPLDPLPVGPQHEAMLRTIEKRLDEWVLKGAPHQGYLASTLMGRVDAYFEKYYIRRLEDGTMMGAPLLCDDEFNQSKGEMRMRFVSEIVFWSALDWKYNGNENSLRRAMEAMDHAVEQGFAYASGMGTNHHYGYQIRELYKGIWILREPLAKAGRLEEYVKVLTYWSGLQETRRPYDLTRDGILDAWHVLHNAKVISAMLQKDTAAKYTCMKALSDWTSGSLSYTPGTIGGIKVDGTSFHHGGHYPGYTTGGMAALGEFCFYTEGTDLILSEPARRVMKHIFMSVYDYTCSRDWGFGVCGRHPFASNMTENDVMAYARLALVGDLTGKGLPADPELAGAYIAMSGTDKELMSRLKKIGIAAYRQPEGFRVYNYGAFGIHRRDDWMITLKGYNTDVWSSEIYTADNRFGRYQSYGTVQLMGPEGELASGYTQKGWDWNRYPGGTSIHLPFDLLDSPNKSTLMERNTSRFPGVSSLEGRNGCLAFTYEEKDRVNFCAGATATKSVFCFDNRIVHIGTGIKNTSSYPTETTLYQLLLTDRTEGVDINDEYTDAFPYAYRHTKGGQVVLTDTKGNIYIIKDASGLVVEKKHQTSPSDTKKASGEGDFIAAYLDHGSSPENASYEYMLLVKPSGKEIGKFSKKLPYTVLQADDNAHIVSDDITGITAYVSYKGFKSETTRAASAEAETIVMERAREDGTVVMSICTPDLGINDKSYTTEEPSKIIVKRVVLDGKYSLAGDYDNVSLVEEDGRSVAVASCIHGQPVEFVLVRK